MKLKRSQFLVKNFTSNQITVKLGDNDSYKETTVENGIVYKINYDGTIELSGTATVNTYILVATLDESLDGKTAFLSGAVTNKVFVGITDLEDDGTTVVENDTECYTKITYMAKGN